MQNSKAYYIYKVFWLIDDEVVDALLTYTIIISLHETIQAEKLSFVYYIIWHIKNKMLT